MTIAREIPLSDFIRRMAALGGDVEAAVIRGLQGAAMRLDGFVAHEIQHASPHPAVDRSELLNSRDLQITPKGAVFAAWAICNAIAKRGIAPRHFLAKAWARFLAGKYVGREVGAELEQLAQMRNKGRVGQETRRGSRLKEEEP